MSKKEKILILYFTDKLNIIEISSFLDVTKQYVSKIIRNDPRYIDEKLRRKEANKLKQVERVKSYIKQQRKNRNEDIARYIMEFQHNQAAAELSGRKTINNRAFRNWNSSIYKFNNRTKEFIINKDFRDKVSYATPKKINWNI